MKNSYFITLLLLGAFLASPAPLLEAQVPVINSAGNATAQVAVPFTYRITATISPTSYSILSSGPSSLVQSLYRGAFGNQTTASGKIWMAGSGQEFPNAVAFAAITSNGSAVSWGNSAAGGNATAVSSSLSSNVTAIYSNSQAFAALKSNGSVVTWGDALSGGSTSGAVGGNLTSGVVSISSAKLAFAALKSNGSVVTWGNPDAGGDSTSLVGGSLSFNVTAVFSNAGAFAALKSNGSVVTWGDPGAGGNSTLFEFDQDFKTVETSVASQLTSGVVSISSTRSAFAAIKSNGSVVTWGDLTSGGAFTPPTAGSLSSNVTAVFSNDDAFAALKSNGSVVTWGASMSGGDSSSVSANLTSGVTAIYSNRDAFAALKSNGSVVTWGMPFSGGVSSFPVGGNLTSGVKSISSTQFAFAALKSNGSVVTWGDSMSGGDSSLVTPPPVGNNEDPPTFTSVADLLTSNVTAIYSTQSAFAALKSDGSVVTWGSSDLGGDSSSVGQLLTSNVTAIAANSGAFAALKRDGSIVTWGFSSLGDIPAPTNIGAPAADITSLTGLSFNSANGSLSGSPTKSGNFSLRLGATNTSGTGNAPFSLLILPAPGMSLSGDLSFGNVFVGQNATRNFSITNPASGPLTVSSIASSNSSFTLTGSTNFTIAPSTTQNVTVRFQPPATGNFTANITIASNAGNNSLTATGAGVSAASPITITGNLSFGNVTVNQTANSTLSIKNNASNTVTMSVAVPSWLTANATGNFTLAGNATRNVTVTFRPTSEGNFTGNITATSSVGNAIISASGAGVHTRIIGLSGNLSFGTITVNQTANRTLSIRNTGTGPLNVTGISYPTGFSGNWSAGTIAANATQNVTVSFRPTTAGNFTGNITVNSTATSGNSTITASGTGVLAPVITSNLSASGAVGGNFSYQITADNTPTSFGNATALPAGLSLNATTGLISGKPTAAGNSTVTLRATNAGGTGTANLTVSISQSRIIALSGNLSFGNATVNSMVTRNLTITNTGTGPLSVSGISYPPGFSGNWSGTINATATRNVPVFFRPTTEGNFTGNITVNSTATSGNNTISASGTGVHTRIIGLSGDLAFGSALANRTLDKNPTRTLTISNTGTGNITITRVEHPAGFRVFAFLPDASLGGNYTTVNVTSSGLSVSLAELTGNLTLPIVPGSSKSLLVAFSPTAATTYSGNITVASTATNAAGNSSLAASGAGVTTPLSITGNLSFGNVTVNQQAARTLSITNLDTETHVLSFAIGAGYSVAFSPFPYDVMGNPVNLPAGATVNAIVTFSPTSVQAYSGNLTITSDILGNRTISATGTATHSRVIGLSGNLSFGNATVNSTITRNLAITNTGTAPLNVTGITYNTAGFSGNWSGGTIAPNATQNVTVSFRPTSEGNFTGNITVTSNSTSGPSTIAASGSGVHSLIIGLSGNLSFGTLTVNQTANRTLSIRNTGTGPLNVTGISYPTGFSGNWSAGTIAANATQNVTITFRPLEEQLYDGNITINSTATSGTPTIAASGSGFHSRVIGLSGNLSFGGLTITQTANRTLSISNTGTGSLSVSGISLPAGFSGNWTGTISPQTTQDVSITFSPLVEKNYTGNITINSTATSGVSAIAASGSGTPTRIIGLTGNLSFGGQTVNQIANRALSIRNTGTGPLNVTGISYPPGFSGNWSGGTIEANSTQNVTISFRPTLEGLFNGNISINSTATSGNNTIAASGTGIHSRIMGLSGNLAFGTLTVNQTANRTLSISNTGTGPLSITGINYPTGFSGNWSSGTINPNTTQNVTVSFRPTSEGNFTGNITVTSNSTSGPSTIAASGSGVHSRIIGLSGNLSFGNQTVYRAANRTLSISNTGTGNLTVNSISFPAGFSGNWSGTIAPGATQNVTVLFTPTVAQTNPMVGQSYNGNATVVSDATVGSGVRSVSGVAAVPVTAMVAVSGGALPSTTVSTFQIGKYEVTWDEWKAVRGWAVANGYTDLANVGDVQGATTSTEKDSYGTFPVDNVTWFDVVKWCNAKSEMEKLTPVYQVNGATYKTGNEATVSLLSNATGYRLPSEPEWEWAARGGNSTKGFTYSGNNTADVVAWYQSNSDGVTKSVGTKKSNELGIFDMSGNVWEWCWDEVEPARPIRGGSFVEGASAAVVTYRPSGMSPTDRLKTVGFRLVRGSGVIAPAISHPGRTDGQVGFPYSYQIQAKNKPTSYGATPLPAGLSINATTGLISGTPTVAGLFTANLTASNAGGTNKNYMLFHIAPSMNALITTNPNSISFSNRKVNQTSTLALNISNPRNESLNIQLISYPSGSVFSGESYQITLSGGSNNNFNVNFTPTQPTNYTGNITVQFSTTLDSIPRVFSVNIPVSGSGTP